MMDGQAFLELIHDIVQTIQAINDIYDSLIVKANIVLSKTTVSG